MNNLYALKYIWVFGFMVRAKCVNKYRFKWPINYFFFSKLAFLEAFFIENFVIF